MIGCKSKQVVLYDAMSVMIGGKSKQVVLYDAMSVMTKCIRRLIRYSLYQETN